MGYWTYYVEDPEASCDGCDPHNDLITAINPAYMAVMATAGSETNLVFSLIGPTVATVFFELSSKLVPVILEQSFVPTISNLQPALISSIESLDGISEQEAIDQFLATWTNATTAPNTPVLWQTIGIASGSNLPYASAELLWRRVPGDLPNFFNESLGTASIWTAASAGDPDARGFLQYSFELDSDQLDSVLAWRLTFNTDVTVPNVLATFNVNAVSDLAWLQWGTGLVTNKTSIRDLDPSLGLAGIFEVAIWSTDINTQSPPLVFNVSQSKELLNGTNGLFETGNLQTFYFLIATQDEASLLTLFGVTLAEATTLQEYFTYISGTFVDGALQQAFSAGGGFITTRTPDQMLWYVDDPLLVLVQNENTDASYYHNQTTEEQAMEEIVYETFYTGAGDLDDLFSLIEWNGISLLPAGEFWEVDIPIQGTNGHQFHPFLDKSDELIVWVSELLRPMDLVYDDDLVKKGIKLYRFRLDERDFLPNSTFYQEIQGFGNMSLAYKGVPVMFSKAMMFDCPAEWRDKIDGLFIDPEMDDTFLDVEPITGSVMDVAKRLQVNIFIENKTEPLNLWSRNFPKDIIYPAFWGDENAEIDDKKADDFKDAVYRIIMIRVVVFWVGISVGSVLALLGIALSTYALWKNRGFSYEIIGDLDEEKQAATDDEDEKKTNGYGI
eukprot:TRINITY_DN7680_c0_g1_i1.p1 TRINITY_DN7680_c0_g1~~TRINITY_DN7680_c0_g1_i1.p1  ORF type:complete len:765 (-),score=133.01 TRINITY_DN7680_c0_g1_i1:185-2191(-)